jgi:two-component system sporulation sensor kinase B
MVLYRHVLGLGLSVVISVIFLAQTAHALTYLSPIKISKWEMMWEQDPERTIDKVIGTDSNEWFSVTEGEALPEKPTDVQSAWLHLELPDYQLASPALLIKKLVAKDIKVYIDNKLVFESNRSYAYNRNELFLPLNDREKTLHAYILLSTESKWLGVKGEIKIGEYQSLNKKFMKHEMLDVILGATLVFISLAMYICTAFLSKAQRLGWSSLSTIILAVGLMIVTYSPYLYTFFSEFETIYYYSFDLASMFVMPSLFLFFEKIFGRGPYGLITRIKNIQIVMLVFSITFFFLRLIWDELNDLYSIISLLTFGFSVIVGNIILFIAIFAFCLKRHKEAIIFAVGFGIFGIIGVIELAWYFFKGMSYELFYWKWGILFFLASLVIILTRRIMANYEQVLTYSKQLEVFNNELQRSEKMEVISQLAASVAHEVRNPLQVTRGFLQLLSDKSTDGKEKGFMNLAIDELDRASEIITDFLTFAKPQLDHITHLNIKEELKQIEGILIPLATMQGAVINADLTPDLFVKGNSSKFKQALVNIIKNSIEALGQDGEILIRAYEDKDGNIVISIKDNGEGMSESEIKRLGEPYYSKKTKGTGLGLMVTFRIIEVMQGKLEFSSIKGVGTEAQIVLPSSQKTLITLEE